MNSDLRRAKRYHDFIPVLVTAPKGMNTLRATGPFSGRIINISRYGGCLLMPFGVLDPDEVFNATYHKTSPFLEIQGSVSLKNGHFKLSARPVWTDPFVMDDLRAFKLGIEFLLNPEGEQMNSIIESIHPK
jgi:hypothetical protein